MTPKMTYAALIPTCNRPDFMVRFLASLAAQTRLPDQVVVIDQSDDDRTRQVFEAWDFPADRKIYAHRVVKSLILSRNVGLDLCNHGLDYVAFFDDDLVLDPGFSEAVMEVFEKNPSKNYGGGMGKIRGTQFHPKIMQRFFLMPHEGSGRFLASGAPTLPHWKNEFTETEFLSGGLTFWRQDVLQANRYDERLVGYGHGDDVDVSYRISRKYKLFFEPRALCDHEEHSPGRDRMRVFRKGWIQNMYYLGIKNGISKLPFFWCVLGHILRDAVCGNYQAVLGDLTAVWNILTGSIDTVSNYQGFLKSRSEART